MSITVISRWLLCSITMSDTEKLRGFCFDLADLMRPLGLFRININLDTTDADALGNIHHTLGLLEIMTGKCKEIVEYEEKELKQIKSAIDLRGFIERELEKRD